MKQAKTIVLVVVAAVMALVTWQLHETEKRRQETDLARNRLFAFDCNEVRRIEITTSAAHLVCRKLTEDGKSRWHLVEPVEDRADNAAIDSILAELGELEKNIIPGGADAPAPAPAQYGLDKPRATLSFHTGEESHMLKLGTLSIDGTYRYAMADGTDDIVAVQKQIFDLLNRPLGDFRDKDLVDVKRHTAAEVTMAPRKGPVLSLSKRTGRWELNAPVKDLADGLAVGKLIDKLDALRATQFVDDAPADPARYGLDRPVLQVTVSTTEGNEPVTMTFGNGFGEEPEPERYAAVSNRKAVFAVKTEALEDLVRGEPNDFRSRDIAEVTVTRITRVRLLGPASTVELAKTGDEWNFTAGLAGSADAGAVRKFLTELNDIEVASFVDDAPSDLSAYGLAEPTEIRIAEASGEFRSVLLVGSEGADGLYARRPGFPGVFAVKSDFGAWTENEFAFLPRLVLRLPKLQIAKVRFESPRRRGVIEKDEDGKWRMVEPIDAACDGLSVDAMLQAASNLKADSFVARLAEADPRRFGFDKPSFKLALTTRTKDAEKTTTILLGKRSEQGRTYAQASGEELVFTLSSWVTSDLEREPLPRDIGDLYAGEPLKVSIEYEGATTVLAVSPEGRWAVEGLAPAETDNDKAKATARAFDYLRAVRYEAYAPTGLAPYGLDDPKAVVAGTFADGTVTVRIGATNHEGQYYALVEGRPSVVLLAPFDVRKFLVMRGDFRKRAASETLPDAESLPP